MNTYALFVAPWDLQDVGTRELFAWARDQGLNTVFLASAYHAGWLLQPHAHSRKAFMVEDGTCYFHPNPKEYAATPLKPVVAGMARDRDWCAEACAVARELGLKIYFWTVCLHNSRLGLLHPDVTCRNVYGDSYPHALCPSHPAAREYVAALVRDQAKRYAPDGFLLEATRYHRGRTHGNLAGGVAGHHHERDGLPMPALEQHLLNLSFAPTDLAVAQDQGVDVTRVQRHVRDHLDRWFQTAPYREEGVATTLAAFQEACPDLSRYEQALHEQTEKLIEQIKSDTAVRDKLLIGDSHRRAFDVVLVGCYNQSQNRCEAILGDAAARCRPGQRLIAGLRLGFNPPPNTPAINSQRQGCDIARAVAQLDVAGIAWYFYGESPRSSLSWIKPMIEATQPRRLFAKVREIRVALIGAGVIGAVHLRAMREVPGVRLHVVADRDAAKAHALATGQEVEHVADSPEAVVRDPAINLVIVATPPNTHVRFACAVLQSGKHLLLEKPMGLHLDDADRILDAAQPSSQAVGVALVHRYDGNQFLARELIRHGAIGKVRLVRYRSGKNMYGDARFDGTGRNERSWLVDPAVAGGGILPSSSIHTLSVISFLLGYPRFLSVAGAVRCSHPRAFKGIEDDVSLLLQLEGGIGVVFEESWATDLDYELMIQGERGHLRFHGPAFNEVGLTGVCDGPTPARSRQYFEANRLVCRPHELDHLVPPYFAGLATDMIAACRGENCADLPGLLHARNMRAIIAAAVDAAAAQRETKIDWRSAPRVG